VASAPFWAVTDDISDSYPARPQLYLQTSTQFCPYRCSMLRFDNVVLNEVARPHWISICWPALWCVVNPFGIGRDAQR